MFAARQMLLKWEYTCLSDFAILKGSLSSASDVLRNNGSVLLDVSDFGVSGLYWSFSALSIFSVCFAKSKS